MNYLSKNIKFLREGRLAISQEEFYSRFFAQNSKQKDNPKKSTISSWEKGKNTPHVDVLIKIAGYFNISLDDLVFKDLATGGYVVNEPSESYGSSLVDLEKENRLLKEKLNKIKNLSENK